MLFAKYFIFGILGLMLELSVPRFPVDWLCVVGAGIYLDQGMKRAALLIFILSFCYSVFSLASFWQIALPHLGGLWFFHFLCRRLELGESGTRIFLLMVLWFCNSAFWQSFFLAQGLGGVLTWGDLWSLGGTLVFGVAFLPLVKGILKKIWVWVPRPRRAMGELPLYQARFSGKNSMRNTKRPFGFKESL